jgi:hypothetical protein
VFDASAITPKLQRRVTDRVRVGAVPGAVLEEAGDVMALT